MNKPTLAPAAPALAAALWATPAAAGCTCPGGGGGVFGKPPYTFDAARERALQQCAEKHSGCRPIDTWPQCVH